VRIVATAFYVVQLTRPVGIISISL